MLVHETYWVGFFKLNVKELKHSITNQIKTGQWKAKQFDFTTFNILKMIHKKIGLLEI